MAKSLTLIWRTVVDKLHKPMLPPRTGLGADDTGFVLTGDSTIDLIVEAIRQKQSVVLSGPRGCGKSYCVAAAIKKAKKLDIILPDADIFLQGNREFPRDYLMEDAFVLRYNGVSVVPEMRSAPLFKFAQRDEENKPTVTGTDRHVKMKSLPDGSKKLQPVKRFVLFLDEINRFSDGILDSLLSVLEERKAILAGDTYRLPVVVLMTMNPPGYDGTARRLSPPLQARIGRNWRLYSPDLRTQTDILIPERRRQILTTRLERVLASKTAAAVGEMDWRKPKPEGQDLRLLHNVLTGLDHSKASAPITDEELKSLSREHWEEQEQNVIESWLAEGKDGILPLLCRKAAVVCLCLWGIPRTDESAHVYLTEETRDMLTALAGESLALQDAMEEILSLCSYGPDGRAATDWIQSAYSLAGREKEREKARAKKREEALKLAKKREEALKLTSTAALDDSEKGGDSAREALADLPESAAASDDPEEDDLPDPPVLERHFRATVIDTLSHKLNDTFSAANEPEKERRKHKAILSIFDEIFSPTASRRVERRSDKLQRYLTPLLDDERWLNLHATVLWLHAGKDNQKELTLRGIFKKAGLLRRIEHERWLGDLPTERGGLVGAYLNQPAKPLSELAVEAGILVKEQISGTQSATFFASIAWQEFFGLVCADALFNGPLTEQMLNLLNDVKEVLQPIEEDVLEYYPSLRQFGKENHFKLFVINSGGEDVEWRKTENRRRLERLLARAFTMVWDQATGLTGDDWYREVAEQLGLPAEPVDLTSDRPADAKKTPKGASKEVNDEFVPILPNLLSLLDFQAKQATVIDWQCFFYRLTPAHWLGSSFKPSGRIFVPGNLSSNSFKRGVNMLTHMIQAKLNEPKPNGKP